MLTPQEIVLALGPGYQNAPLDLLIPAALQAVLHHCNRPSFDLAEREIQLDGPGNPLLTVPVPPIVSIESIVVDGEELDPAEYDHQTSTIRRREGNWPTGLGNITLTYTGGYEEIPEAVRYAWILSVKALADRARTTDGVQSERLGDWSYTLPTGERLATLPQAAQHLLESYRVPRRYA